MFITQTLCHERYVLFFLARVYFHAADHFQSADGVAQFFNTMRGDFKTPWLAPEEDSGAFVKALIVDEAPGKNLIAYREWATLREMVQAFEKASGVKSEVVEVPVDAPNEHLPLELKIELDEGYSYWEEFGYEARDDPTVIHPKDVSHLTQRGYMSCANILILVEKPSKVGDDGTILPKTGLQQNLFSIIAILDCE